MKLKLKLNSFYFLILSIWMGANELFALAATDIKYTPVVIYHGLGDSCCGKG